MTKNTMKLKYKPAKREKNKKVEVENDFKSIIRTMIIVLITIGVMYLLMLGMEKLGVFQRGYTRPDKGETEVSQTFINIGTVFNRDNDEYYVLFDNYESDYTQSTYINYLIDKEEDIKVYKVDMSKNENKKYASEEENDDAQSVEDLKINGVTLIKIEDHENVRYISGREDIEEYLK